jgi:hypothetical protein
MDADAQSHSANSLTSSSQALPPQLPEEHEAEGTTEMITLDINWDMFDLGSLDVFYLDEQHLAREDTALTGSDFYDQLMNTFPSLPGLEFMPDNEDELNAHVKPVEHSTNRARKRRIDEIEESTVLPIQEGIYFFITVRSFSRSENTKIKEA